jgi:hypothetical protein
LDLNQQPSGYEPEERHYMGILTEHSLYLQESFEFFAERIVTVQKNPAWDSVTNWTSTGRGGHREGIRQSGIEERRRHLFFFL